MFLIDKPYVSDFLKKTIKDNSIPVIDTLASQELELLEGSHLISAETAQLKARNNPLIYTNSENSIGWITEHLASTDIPNKIDMFKDKFKFRELTAKLFPNFFFKKISLKDLDKLDIKTIPLPFIIKPSVGFFSMGVYKVNVEEEWSEIKSKIKDEISKSLELYPNEVLDYDTFIIEQCIDGEEFAIDAYFDSNGEPVILNILKHSFSDDSDVSDRIYTSSKNIIKQNIDQISNFLKEIGEITKVTNFPCHVELRKDINNYLLPIEINPMRFGGWCTTADFTYYAYGINPYLYFYNQLIPDWSELLKDKDDKTFALIVLDNSTGVESHNIKSFDYNKLLSNFDKPLELRKMDYKKFPIFGFLFTETSDDNLDELDRILKSDLREYIS